MENKRIQKKKDEYIEAFTDCVGGKLSKYEMRVFPKTADDGTTYWTATFSSVPECIGGGDTLEEAVKEAMENLTVYTEFLKESKS